MAEDPNADPAVEQDPPADPNADPQDPAADPNPADPAAEPDPKARAREGYEQRKMRERLESLEKENRQYRARADEERKAKLTAEQLQTERLNELERENTRLNLESLQNRIAAEFKLPATMAQRLIGSDEDSMRADAADLAKLVARTKAGTNTDPGKDTAAKRVYKRSELRADPRLAASAEVLEAAREGRVTDG